MTFTEADLQHFHDYGWVKLEQAFDRDQVLQAQDAVWELMRERGHAVYRDKPETWTEPLIHLKEGISDDPRCEACITQRWRDAVEDLVGKKRWTMRDKPMPFGWWPVNFINPALEDWIVPTIGWHWDGQHFHHHYNSPEQGLLMIALFSDVESQGGATCVLENSHHLVGRYLFSKEPDGVSLADGNNELKKSNKQLRLLSGLDPLADEDRNDYFMHKGWLDDVSGKQLKVIEATGNAGDIYFMHPFTMHSRSDKIVGLPRFICNWTAPLHEAMQLERDDQAYSPLEAATRSAIGI